MPRRSPAIFHASYHSSISSIESWDRNYASSRIVRITKVLCGNDILNHCIYGICKQEDISASHAFGDSTCSRLGVAGKRDEDSHEREYC